MTFTWIGNVGHLTDEDIIAIAEDMWDGGFTIYDVTATEHLARIDPEGTLNINAREFVKRVKGLGL